MTAAVAAEHPAVDVESARAANGVVQFGLDDFVFDSYDAEFFLDRDSEGRSTLLTTETFIAVFPADQNRGMKRAIPDDFEGEPVNVSNISVTDETGKPRPIEIEHDEGFTLVTSAADSFVEGAQTYVFTYEQSNVTRYYADTDADEWYWDTNGVGWNQPFGSVTATVHLGDGLSGALTDTPRCYWGGSGSRSTCEISSSGPNQFTATQRSLGARQNLTLALGFEPGTFTARETAYLSAASGFVQPLGALGALAALVWAFRTRRTTLADAPGRPTIIAEYSPPQDVSLITSALLLGKRNKAIAAQILEFAVKGKLRIRESESRGFFSSQTTYRLELVDPTGVQDTPLEILRELFGTSLMHGAVRDLAKPDQKLSQKLYKIVQRENTGLVAAGYRRKISASSYLPVLVSVVSGIVAVVFGFLLIEQSLGAAIPFVLIAVAIAAGIATVMVLFRVPVTARGAEARDHLEGLELYITLAEADRLRMLQSPEGALRERSESTGEADVLKIYEKLLPYAVLFGLEERWSEELGRYYSERSPDWYAGSGAFNGAIFASGISSMSSSIASSYSGSASSSSSGGSGGGGSSGGGGGGGGGGGV
ncbi:DUF2207 family protein [Salinibacterium sp. PAMC 21357]|uniref:DUF2207 family protein n=1 Tax=Salinibacterium sp. PAMC 21357 TaxID=1112215 RepID=UPI0011466836|nr:DUF2207 domain-containing protein [Salinibacterium sp. PAMC 21357]